MLEKLIEERVVEDFVGWFNNLTLGDLEKLKYAYPELLQYIGRTGKLQLRESDLEGLPETRKHIVERAVN